MGPPFRSNKFFMHNRAMDICIEVLKHRYIGEDYSIWHVRLWNLGYTGKPWIVDEVKSYKIKQTEYDNYRELTEEEMLTARSTTNETRDIP